MEACKVKFDLKKDIDLKRAKMYFEKLINDSAKIELKKFAKKRTLQQNAYFHCACTILSDFSGYTVEEMKLIIKDKLEFMNYDKGGHHFYRSSADLNKEEFMILVDYTRGFGQDQGCYIPTPQEYYESQFDTEKELKI